MYPNPWYGVYIWNGVKLFIDQKTRSKLILIPGVPATDGQKVPSEVLEFISIDQIPRFCGGTSTDTILNMADTIPR